MKKFRYALDPVCLLACASYALNRWWLRQAVGGEFLRNHFNDLLFIPAALPLMLWVQRQLGLRTHDERPTWAEVGLHFVVWSIAAEGIAPLLFKSAVGDWRDVVAYGVGAAVAGAWWNLT